MALLNKLAAFARSPQGRRLADKAKTYANSPEGKAKINEVREKLVKRGGTPPR